MNIMYLLLSEYFLLYLRSRGSFNNQELKLKQGSIHPFKLSHLTKERATSFRDFILFNAQLHKEDLITKGTIVKRSVYFCHHRIASTTTTIIIINIIIIITSATTSAFKSGFRRRKLIHALVRMKLDFLNICVVT